MVLHRDHARNAIFQLLPDDQPADEKAVHKAIAEYDKAERISAPRTCEPGAIKLFVGNIPKHLTVERLENVFGYIGATARIEINYDGSSQMSKGSAFVWFVRRDDAVKAMLTMHGSIRLPLPNGAMWKPLTVRPATRVPLSTRRPNNPSSHTNQTARPEQATAPHGSAGRPAGRRGAKGPSTGADEGKGSDAVAWPSPARAVATDQLPEWPEGPAQGDAEWQRAGTDVLNHIAKAIASMQGSCSSNVLAGDSVLSSITQGLNALDLPHQASQTSDWPSTAETASRPGAAETSGRPSAVKPKSCAPSSLVSTLHAHSWPYDSSGMAGYCGSSSPDVRPSASFAHKFASMPDYHAHPSFHPPSSSNNSLLVASETTCSSGLQQLNCCTGAPSTLYAGLRRPTLPATNALRLQSQDTSPASDQHMYLRQRFQQIALQLAQEVQDTPQPEAANRNRRARKAPPHHQDPQRLEQALRREQQPSHVQLQPVESHAQPSLHSSEHNRSIGQQQHSAAIPRPASDVSRADSVDPGETLPFVIELLKCIKDVTQRRGEDWP